MCETSVYNEFICTSSLAEMRLAFFTGVPKIALSAVVMALRTTVPLLVALLIIVTAPVLAQSASSQQQQNGTNQTVVNETSDAPINATSNGTDRLSIAVSQGQTRMTIGLNYSLFTSLPGAGQLRFASNGLYRSSPLIELSMGIRFNGTGPLDRFLNDPLGRFTILYDYTFRSPVSNTGVNALNESRQRGRSILGRPGRL